MSVSYIKLYVTAVWPLPHLTGDINVSSIPEFQDWLKELDEQAFRSDRHRALHSRLSGWTLGRHVSGHSVIPAAVYVPSYVLVHEGGQTVIEQMQSKRRQCAGSVSKQPQSPVSKYYPHRRSKTIKHWKGRNAIQELRTDDEEKSSRLGLTGRGQYAKMFSHSAHFNFLTHTPRKFIINSWS